MSPLGNADGEMNFMRAVITSMGDKLHLKCLLDILLKISNRWLSSRQHDIWVLELWGGGGREVWARTIDWEVIRALDGKLHGTYLCKCK